MAKEKTYMNTWMVPKNKRTLLYILEALPLFITNTDNNTWSGDRSLQRQFEKALEQAGLKKAGTPYHHNSGGGRTYASQILALGLIFFDDMQSQHYYRPTLAGEAILKGENPLSILQNQLLKMQYPSPYSLSKGVNLSPDFKIKPFCFILKLLLDSDIQWLSTEELGFFVITYAKTINDLNKVKEMILLYRETSDLNILPSTFMEDTVSPRTKNHSFEKRITYLKDKANIFFNYLDSTQLVYRDKTKKIIHVNKEYINIIKKAVQNCGNVTNNIKNLYHFQRNFGLDLIKTKDTRSFAGTVVSHETIKESLVKNKFFMIAKQQPVLKINRQIIDKISSETGVAEDDVVKYLDKLPTYGLTYFEEQYLKMAQNGLKNCLEFEKATQQIFKHKFKFKAKHLGQLKPQNRRGGNPDIIFISENENFSGIIDTKAYKKYSINNDHKNRMINNYIPNYSEHSENKPLQTFIYIAGGFSKNFETDLNSIIDETNISGIGISAKNLLRLTQKFEANNLTQKNLLKIFSYNKEITSIDIDNYKDITY